MKRNNPEAYSSSSSKRHREDLESRHFNAYAQMSEHQRTIINLITAIPDSKTKSLSETAYNQLVTFLEQAPLNTLNFNEILTNRFCFGFTILSFLMTLAIKAGDVQRIFTLLLERVPEKLDFHLKAPNQSPFEIIIEHVLNQNLTEQDLQYTWLLKALIQYDVIGLQELNQEWNNQTGITLFTAIVDTYQVDLLELIVKKNYFDQLHFNKANITPRTSHVNDFVEVLHNSFQNKEFATISTYFEQKKFQEKLLLVANSPQNNEIQNLDNLKEYIANAPLNDLNLNHVIQECGEGVNPHVFQGATVLQALLVISISKNYYNELIMPFVKHTPEKIDLLTEGEGDYKGINCLKLMANLPDYNFSPVLKEFIERDILGYKELQYVVNDAYQSIFLNTLIKDVPLLELILQKPYLADLNFNARAVYRPEEAPMSIFGAMCAGLYNNASFAPVLKEILRKVPLNKLDFNLKMHLDLTPLHAIVITANQNTDILMYILENVEPSQLNFKAVHKTGNGIGTSVLSYIPRVAINEPKIVDLLLERFNIEQFDFAAKINLPPHHPDQTISEAFMATPLLATKVDIINFLLCASNVNTLNTFLKTCNNESIYTKAAQRLEQELIRIETLATYAYYKNYRNTYSKLIQIYQECDQEDALKALAKDVRLLPWERDTIYDYLAHQRAFKIQENKPCFESMNAQDRKVFKKQRKSQLLTALNLANKIQTKPNMTKKLLALEYTYGIDKPTWGFPSNVNEPIFDDLDDPKKMFLHSIKGLRKQEKLKEKLNKKEDLLAKAEARIAELETKLNHK